MDSHLSSALPPQAESSKSAGYESPTFEVISLDCEITAYAPDDGDTPLF
jgi:hypothetical protein